MLPNCKYEKLPKFSQVILQLSRKVVLHGHMDPGLQVRKVQVHSWLSCHPSPLLCSHGKETQTAQASVWTPGSSAWQWPIGLSLLAFLPWLNLWGSEPDVPIWPTIAVVSSNVQLFQGLFTECPIYLGFLSAITKLPEEKRMLHSWHQRENMNQESRKCC